MRAWWLLLAMYALPAFASDFGARYPVGTIRDAEQARAVLKEADAEMARIAKSASERDTECLRGFLVNSCRDDVRRQKELAEREVQRVRIEARDMQRRIDAERVAKQRATKAAAQSTADAQRLTNEQKARAATTAREEEVKRRQSGAPADRAPSPEAESRPKRERLTAAERADNARKFQQKQEQAEKRAQQVEAERKENELRRIEKRKQIEQREAEREAIRKKAAESLK